MLCMLSYITILIYYCLFKKQIFVLYSLRYRLLLHLFRLHRVQPVLLWFSDLYENALGKTHANRAYPDC